MQTNDIVALMRRVTPEDLSKALDKPPVHDGVETNGWKGFPLKLVEGRDNEWLANAVKRAVAVTITDTGPRSYLKASYGRGRDSNLEVKQELERLAKLVRKARSGAKLAHKAWSVMFKRSDAVDSRLYDHAWDTWDGKGGIDTGDGVAGTPPDYTRFEAAVNELEWLAGFLKNAALATEGQGVRWRESVERKLRIERGQLLAFVFEAAYGKGISINNWPTDSKAKSPTPFMHFYQQVVGLFLGETETKDLPRILKEARKLKRDKGSQIGLPDEPDALWWRP